MSEILGLVSAVITTHNRKDLLLLAIQSVLNQTYKRIECIVVDDASTDGTKEMLNDYIKQGRLKYIYIPAEKSCGGNHARNIGIQNANGKYIAFLDDDDEWLPEKIEKQIIAFEQNKDVGFVYCGLIREKNMNPDTRVQQDVSNPKYKDGDLSKEVLIHIITNTSAIMVKKEILDHCGYFDEALKYWQEYELCIRILQITNAKCVRESLVLYRILQGDKSRLSNKLEGWEGNVKYIEEKHKVLLGMLSYQEEGMRKTYVCIDGFIRGKNAGSLFFMMKYMCIALWNRDIRKAVIKKIKNTMKNKKILGKRYL